MSKNEVPELQRHDAAHPRYYSPETLPLIQSLLATLANIEFEFEQECTKADGILDARLKARVLERLRVQHQARREPYVRQLAVLQKRTFGAGLEESAA